MRPSGLTRLNHSVKVRRLDSRRIRFARKRAGAWAVCGSVSRLASFTLHPAFFIISSLVYSSLSLKSSSGVLLVYLSLPSSLSVSMCVLVFSTGFQPASVRTDIICLWELGLKVSHLQYENGASILRVSILLRNSFGIDVRLIVPYLVSLGITSLISLILGGKASKISLSNTAKSVSTLERRLLARWLLKQKPFLLRSLTTC